MQANILLGKSSTVYHCSFSTSITCVYQLFLFICWIFNTIMWCLLWICVMMSVAKLVLAEKRYTCTFQFYKTMKKETVIRVWHPCTPGNPMRAAPSIPTFTEASKETDEVEREKSCFLCVFVCYFIYFIVLDKGFLLKYCVLVPVHYRLFVSGYLLLLFYLFSSSIFILS